MENKATYVIINLIILFTGLLILFCNNDLALSLKIMFLSDRGFGDAMDIEIFRSYSYMFLIIGGILFYKGIHGITKYEIMNFLINQNKKNHPKN